jgi:GTPase SAR1 family protein
MKIKKVTALAILSKLQEWFTCVENGTTSTFVPVRLTVSGQAGSGKTVLINTLVNSTSNNSKQEFCTCLCPTGSAAFNAGGMTSKNYSIYHDIQTQLTCQLPA